jgi:DNA-binding SARP family transcriptional activator
MAKIQVQLFGQTTVVTPEGSVVSDLGGIKPRQVLEMLALALGTPVSKDRLVEQLWGDTPPRTYIATLESYISLLRRRMGVARGRRSALATTSNGYVLDPAQVQVDLDEFRRLVQPTMSGTAEVALARTERALGLVSGELLASEPYAEWAGVERGQFAAEFLHAANRAAAHALELGRGQVAVELARRAIGVDAIAETSWQLLIRGLSATGARSEALRAYLDLRTTLVEALGTEPCAASRELYLELLAEDRVESAPASSVHEVRTLLSLLREALDGCPDIDLSVNDRRITARAERLVAAA